MPNIINFSKPFSKLLMMALCLALVLAMAACGNGQANGNGDLPNNGEDIVDSDAGEAIDVVSGTVKNMLLEMVQVQSPWAYRVYFKEDEPDQAEYGDIRIESIEYTGQAAFGGSRAAAFLVQTNHYYDEWQEFTPFYLVIERTAGNDGWLTALGISYDSHLDKTIETIILEVAYSLWDLEVSVKFDGHPEYLGPGSKHIFLDEDYDEEFHYDYDPIYNEGDYWFSYHYDKMSALLYHNETEAYDIINRLDISREDAESYRGIRIGASKDQVLSTYPEIHQEAFWGEEDHLWYNTSDYGMGVGMNLIFWFEDDKVIRIELLNMFN